ncbi:MAG: PLP-dependent transferase [Wenzhouxiangella sp.]|nr:MAG: PLP-dependent transferase [Wenzhouxiangella sp.]
MSVKHTDLVHAGRQDLRSLGVHALPVDLSTTYPLPDLGCGTASLDTLVEGHQAADNPVYARLFNPTVDRWERSLARAEGAEAAVAFSSGMAALTACLLAMRERGSHVVAVRPVYGTSDHLLDSGLLGNEVSWVTADQVGDAIRPDTAMVMVETPANPTLKLVDIEAVVAQAGRVPVLVDSTFATPVLQQPLKHGAALVMHSATKFLGGHGDVMAGVIACSEELARPLRRVRVATGALLHPWAAYLLHRSMPTLKLRVEHAQSGAMTLARKLANDPRISAIHYPGLAQGEACSILNRQMNGPGSVLAFEVNGGYAAAAAVMASVTLMTPAVSLGSVDTLIQHPAALTHRVMNEDDRQQCGIGTGLLRLSIGLEEPEDLWHDLDQALEQASLTTRQAA